MAATFLFDVLLAVAIVLALLATVALHLILLRRRHGPPHGPGTPPAPDAGTANEAGATGSSEDQSLFERSKRAVARLLAEVSEHVTDVMRHADRYGHTLEQHEASLEETDDRKNLEQLEARLRAEIRQMRETNLKYRDQLQEANQKIETQRQEVEKLTVDVNQDFLTGLLNRRALDQRLFEEMTRWNRGAAPFSIILFDIDHFKRVNDTYGHPAGDHVLREAGNLLSAGLREADAVGRHGGEELMIILPGTTAAQAEVVAERKRKALALARFRHGGRDIKVTVSAGLTQVVEGDQNITSIVTRTDNALYAAKDRGRNCVVVAPEHEGP